MKNIWAIKLSATLQLPLHMLNRNLVTLSLVSLNCIAFLLFVKMGADWLLPDAGTLLNCGANFSGLTLGGQWWRLFSCMFIHVGVIHLAVNMFSLYSLGADLEEELGSLSLTFIYFVCGFSGSVASLLFNDFKVSAGASGALFGLFGVQFSNILFGFAHGKKGFLRALITAFILLLANLILGFSTDFIDNAAHLGGFVSGFGIGLLINVLQRTNMSRVRILLFSCLTMAAIGVGCFISTSKFPSWYYGMFNSYLQNEKEADRVLSDTMNGKDDDAQKMQVKQAYDIWNTNIKMIDSFPVAPERFQSDIKSLKQRSILNRKIMDLYMKSFEHDSYLFLDTIEYVYQDIYGLTPLIYTLDYYSKPKKEPRALGAKLTPVTIYYDKDWNQVGKEAASYYRLAQKDSLQRINSLVKDYYGDGTVQMKGHYTNDLKDGVFFYFHPNGWYESAGMYNNDESVGKWQHFYENKQIKSEELFSLGKHTFLNFWNEKGDQLLSEGTGIYFEKFANGAMKEYGFYKKGVKDSIWKGYYENGKPYYIEQWKEGQLFNGRSLSESGKHFEYTEEYIEPTPVGGSQSFMEFIKAKTGYPTTNVKKLPEGIVFIELTVDTNGVITHMEPYTKIGAGCEYQAMEIIKHRPKFHSALLRGIPVKEKLLVPFEFKLNR